MKNSADLGGCYSPRPSASVDNTLLDLQNSSYPTQPRSIIANYYMASSVGERDKPNPTLCLANRAAKLRCVTSSGLLAVSRKKNVSQNSFFWCFYPIITQEIIY